MGLFRFLLAFAVVVAHARVTLGVPIIGGALAVKLFFVVSGFYMGLILAKRYKSAWKNFYINRFLRIYPLFWAVLLLEVVRALVFAWFFDQPPAWLTNVFQLFQADSIGLVSVYAASQISLVGVDFFHLLSWNEGQGLVLHGTEPMNRGDLRGWTVFPVGVAWALSCEVLFYAVAPLLVRIPSRRLIGLCIVRTFVNMNLHRVIDPQLATVATSFFGPFQFGYFILGLLSFRLYEKFPKFFECHPSSIVLGLLVLASLVTTSWIEEFTYTGSMVLLWTLVAVGVPALFATTKDSWWDSAIGDLSYPVYLVHLSIIRSIPDYAWKQDPTHLASNLWYLLAVMALSVAVAILLNFGMGRWIDRKRAVIRRNAIALNRHPN